MKATIVCLYQHSKMIDQDEDPVYLLNRLHYAFQHICASPRISTCRNLHTSIIRICFYENKNSGAVYKSSPTDYLTLESTTGWSIQCTHLFLSIYMNKFVWCFFPTSERFITHGSIFPYWNWTFFSPIYFVQQNYGMLNVINNFFFPTSE